MHAKLGESSGAVRSGSETKGRDYSLAVLRAAVGLYWLWEQHWKLPPDFGLHNPRGLMFAFQQSIQYPTLGIYKTFLETLVVPHFHLFGWLVFITEVLIGLSLLFGVLTKAGALIGVVQAINLLVSQASTPEGPWIYLAILVASLILLFAPCNRRLSLDAILRPRIDRAVGQQSLPGRMLRLLM